MPQRSFRAQRRLGDRWLHDEETATLHRGHAIDDDDYAISQLGQSLAKTLIKAHLDTGNDCIRKVVSKHAAVTCESVQYLKNCGETVALLEQDAVLAENNTSTLHVSGQGPSQLQLSISWDEKVTQLPMLELTLCLPHVVRSEVTFNDEPSWCTRHANYLRLQPTSMRQDYNHYSMDGRKLSVCSFHGNV